RRLRRLRLSAHRRLLRVHRRRRHHCAPRRIRIDVVRPPPFQFRRTLRGIVIELRGFASRQTYHLQSPSPECEDEHHLRRRSYRPSPDRLRPSEPKTTAPAAPQPWRSAPHHPAPELPAAAAPALRPRSAPDRSLAETQQPLSRQQCFLALSTANF